MAVTFGNIDRFAAFKLHLIDTDKVFCDIRVLYIILALRFFEANKMRSNVRSLNIHLRLNKHTSAIGLINERLKRLISLNYVVKVGTSYRVTLLGHQVINDLERSFNSCSYKIRKSEGIKTPGKKPLKLG